MLQALKVFVGFVTEPEAMDVQRGIWRSERLSYPILLAVLADVV